MHHFLLSFKWIAACLLLANCAFADPVFVHPGLLHNREDLARMREAVSEKRQPIYAGFEKLRVDPASQSHYQLRGPADEIGRAPSVHFGDYDSDANAAYQCALMGWLTGEKVYFDKAKE